MLKKRVMGVVVVKNGIAVQSFGFNRYLPIGKPEIAVEYLNTWGIDEIAVLDINATRLKTPNFKLVQSLSKLCRVPLTYGGGLSSAEDMTRAVNAGADKVLVNQSFLHQPEVVSEAAKILGVQCVVVSLDAIQTSEGSKVYDYVLKKELELDPIALACKAQELGAGEIFLNSVDRDGSKQGYDLKFAEKISTAVTLPVILCGGVGEVEHFAEGLAIANISGVAAANYFNFTEHSVTLTKQFLNKKSDAKLRLDTYFKYEDSSFESHGRLLKKDDSVLKEMLFEFHPKEVI